MFDKLNIDVGLMNTNKDDNSYMEIIKNSSNPRTEELKQNKYYNNEQHFD